MMCWLKRFDDCLYSPTPTGAVADATQTEHLLHGNEKRERLKRRDINGQITMKRVKRMRVPEEALGGQLLRKLQPLKTSIHFNVEKLFHIGKNFLHYKEVRYKALIKNAAQLHRLFLLTNLLIARRRTLTLDIKSAS
jgi:IS5 family transposase